MPKGSKQSREERKLELSPSSVFARDVESLIGSSSSSFLLRGRAISISSTNKDNEEDISMSYTKDEVDQIIARAVQKAVTDANAAAAREINIAIQDTEMRVAARYAEIGAVGGITDAQALQQAKVIADAMKEVKLTSISSELKVPYFNSSKMTAISYMEEVERYFVALGHQPLQYLYLIKSIIPKESKPWAEHVLRTVKTWDEFKNEFVKRFDTWIDNVERTKALQSKEQKIYEPSEFFIYEMIRMAKLVFPTEKEEESVQRAKLALFPRLRTALGPTTFATPAELYQAVRMVHGNLEAEDRLNNIQNKLPPLMRDFPGRTENKKHNANDESHESGSNYQVRNSFSNYSRGNRGGRNYNNRGRGNGRWNGQGNGDGSQNSNSNQQVPSTSSVNPSHGTPNGNGNGKTDNAKQTKGSWPAPQESSSNIKCYKCNGNGHIARNCPSQTGVALNVNAPDLDAQGGSQNQNSKN